MIIQKALIAAAAGLVATAWAAPAQNLRAGALPVPAVEEPKVAHVEDASLARRAWVPPIPSPSYGLTLTFIPEVGSIDAIMGAAYGIPSPSNYKACILIGNNFTNPGILNWYGPKPGPNHCFQLSAIGDFIARDWASDYHDWVSPYVAVFILPNNVSPPDHSAGTWDLANWYACAVAWATATRVDSIVGSLVVPVRGSLGPVTGCFANLPEDPSVYRVALYVRTISGQYYGAKPVRGTTYSLNSTGCFYSADWFSHPNDPFVPYIVAILLPAGLAPPNVQGDNTNNNNNGIINNFNSWWIGKIISFVEVLRPAPSPSVTPSNSRTPSRTPSISVSNSRTPCRSSSPSQTPPSPSRTPSNTRSPSRTPSNTPSNSITPTHSATPSVTPTFSPSPSPGIIWTVGLPPIGSGGPIYGQLSNVPGSCRFWKVLLYLRSNNTGAYQWWGAKPNSNSYTTLNDDCTFLISNWTSDPFDYTVPAIGLFLVPRGISNIPQFNGQSSLHEHLLNWVVSSYIADRPRIAAFENVFVPPVGSVDPITGLVDNLHDLGSENQFRILVYVFHPEGGWWGPKPVPNYAYQLDRVPSDPVPFTLRNWASAPEDRFVPVVRLILIRAEVVASGKLSQLTVSGNANLPNQLQSVSVTYIDTVRATTT